MYTRHRNKSWLTAALLAGLASIAAQAAWGEEPGLSGDWNGNRTRLADAGVTFDLGYTGEAAHNVNGGTAQLTRYAVQWKLGAKLDLEKLWGWRGATFQIALSERNGRDLGTDAHIGNNQLLQEVYGRGQTWRLSIFALDQQLLGGKLDWRIGRLPVGEDFASFSCDFQNLTFCGAQPGNIVGDYWMNWPVSQWATRLKWQAGNRIYLQLGIYQVNPKYADDQYARRNGWKPDFPGGTTGALIPLELGWTPQLGGRPGSYKLGVWYNTSGGDDLFLDSQRQPRAITAGPPLQRDSRTGIYTNLQQQVSGEAGGSGATLFLNVSRADRATSATDRQIALGVEYAGAFGRPHDKLGFALGATHANGRAADHQRLYNRLHPAHPGLIKDGNEYVGALFYSWSPVPSVALQPNLQYIVHPGGSEQNRDAFVIGLKTVIRF